MRETDFLQPMLGRLNPCFDRVAFGVTPDFLRYYENFLAGSCTIKIPAGSAEVAQFVIGLLRARPLAKIVKSL